MAGVIAFMRFLALGAAFFLVVDRRGRPRPVFGHSLLAHAADR